MACPYFAQGLSFNIQKSRLPGNYIAEQYTIKKLHYLSGYWVFIVPIFTTLVY